MKILALEPYYGGSHKAFLDGWLSRSRHDWTVLGLKAHKWKWRMRHAALTLTQQTEQLVTDGHRFDLLFCSDMLNLAEFKGLAPQSICQLPSIIYFHENQLTYPVQYENERDYLFGFINFISACTADQVWFNSQFHSGEFLSAIETLLKRMPDHIPNQQLADVKKKIRISYPGIDLKPVSQKNTNHPPVITWAARWEFDKNPELFFEVMQSLLKDGIDFRLNILGEQFEDSPAIFSDAKSKLADKINHFGFLEKRSDYLKALEESDIFVSTANHDFFGISVVEAIRAGCFPLLPKRLAYPELLQLSTNPESSNFFYDGSFKSLKEKLLTLINLSDQNKLWDSINKRPDQLMDRFSWEKLVPEFDDAIEKIIKQHQQQ